jgi:hypothetical protein
MAVPLRPDTGVIEREVHSVDDAAALPAVVIRREGARVCADAYRRLAKPLSREGRQLDIERHVAL